MSKEEETVFEKLNSILTEIKDELAAANEALIVIAVEMYETKREFTDILKKMNAILAKLAETPAKPEIKEVSAVQEPERYEAVVMPESKPEWMRKKES